MTDIQCPICNKKYKNRIGYHLVSVHNIKNPDAEEIKNHLIYYRYFHKDESIVKIKQLLAAHGFKFEKLRIEAEYNVWKEFDK